MVAPEDTRLAAVSALGCAVGADGCMDCMVCAVGRLMGDPLTSATCLELEAAGDRVARCAGCARRAGAAFPDPGGGGAPLGRLVARTPPRELAKRVCLLCIAVHAVKAPLMPLEKSSLAHFPGACPTKGMRCTYCMGSCTDRCKTLAEVGPQVACTSCLEPKVMDAGGPPGGIAHCSYAPGQACRTPKASLALAATMAATSQANDGHQGAQRLLEAAVGDSACSNLRSAAGRVAAMRVALRHSSDMGSPDLDTCSPFLAMMHFLAAL